MKYAKLAQEIVTLFSVFQPVDGYTKVSGLVQGDFTFASWKDGVVSADLSWAITEIGSSGEYKIVCTFNSIGEWKIEVRYDAMEAQAVDEIRVVRFLPEEAARGKAL